MTWIKFDSRGRKGSSEPTLRVGGGGLYWNEALHKAMGRPVRIDVLFDTDRQMIGICRGDAFHVSAYGSGGSVSLSGVLRRLGREMEAKAVASEVEAGIWAIRL